MQIGKNSVVSINYTLKNPEGQVVDATEGREPLVYMHGVGQLIPGLEKHLEGKKAGENVKVTVPPAEGYGVRDEQAVQKVPKSAFQGAGEVKVGSQFRAQGPQGQMHVVTVTALTGEEVTVDGNHPLAGVTLSFDVDIVTVRAATKEEIEHGHVHGPGGHHHH